MNQKDKQLSPFMFDKIANNYDMINSILSLGVDKLWRRYLIKNLPNKNNLEILDLATGTAEVAIELAKDKRVKYVIGSDLSKSMLKLANKKILKNNMDKKISLKIEDAQNIKQKDEMFDIVTMAFGIRNVPNYKAVLKQIKRVLKPSGRVLILEFSIPKNIIIKNIYLFYFRYILPSIGGFLSGNNKAYSYLNKTVEDFPYGDSFCKVLKEEGFKDVCHIPLSLGITTLYKGDKLK